MEIAYDHLFWLLSQCFFVAILLLALFRLRTFFGLGLLYITLGVFQFLQSFAASTFSIEIGPDITISSGSMVLFTGSLFAVLIIYIREDALETRKVIYGLVAANLSLAFLMILFAFGMDDFEVNNLYNLPKELFLQNSFVLSLGSIILLLDAFAIIFIYETISKYISTLFFRVLFTMTLVVILDTFLFSIVISGGIENFQNSLITGIFSKSTAALVYSGIFTLYLIYIDKSLAPDKSKTDTYKDIFNTLTFRQKYEDVFLKMENKTKELEEAHEITQLGTFTLEMNNSLFTSSPIFDKIIGFNDRDEKSREAYRNLVHQDDLAQNDQLYANCIKTKQPYNHKYRIIHRYNKKIRWIHEQGKFIFNNGKPLTFKGTIRDITKQKLSEEILQEKEERFHRFANASFEGIGITANNIILDANDRLSELSGYPKVELINDSKLKIIHPDDRKRVMDTIKKGYEGHIEFRLLRKDGNILHVEAKGRAIIYKGRKARVVSLYDISDRVKIKEQLIKSEEKFSKAYFNNPMPIFISSIPDGEFIDINPVFENISGRSRKELIGKKVTDLGFYANEEDRLKLFEELENKGRLHGYEIKFRVKNDKIRDCLMYSEVIDIDGSPSLLSIVNDITEQKKADEALIEQNKELTILGKKISENNRLLNLSQIKFKNLFDKNPISLWEEDFSKVKQLLDKKKDESPDLKEYLDNNPDFVNYCISEIEILNVNEQSLKLLGVLDFENLKAQLSNSFTPKSFEAFKIEFLEISSNKKEFYTETEFLRTDGKTLTALIHFVVLDDDYKNVIVSLVDITELNEAKDKIAESERKFKNLFDKNPVSLWEEDYSEVKKLLIKKKAETNDLKKYLDENLDFVIECITKLEILNVNDISLELFGVNDKQELLDRLDKTFNENSIEGFKKQLIAIAQNMKEFSSESELIGINGNIINVLITFVNIGNDDKAIVSIVDITALNKAKQKIVESEKRFRELFEKSGDAILILKNGIFVECNQATVDMLAYKSRKEFLNSHPSKLSPIFQQDGQKSFEKAVDMMNLALQLGTHRFEWMHTKKNGEDFPVEVLLTVISNKPNNQIIHTVWRDITDRKNAELELKMSERELQKSQEIAQLGNFNLDLTNELMKTSSIFDSIVGLRTNDIKIFDQLRKRVHPEDLEENSKMLQNCVKTGKLFDREFRIINGTTKELKWIHGLGEVLYKDNNPSNFRGTFQDITERKLSELAIKLNEKKLIDVQKIANLGTYEIDLMTNSVSTSKIYNSILGIKKKPKHNKGWWKSITHPDDFEHSELLWQDCIRTGKNYKDEYRIINDKKEIKWIYDLAEVKFENGIPTKVVGTIQDITTRKLSEEKIRRSDAVINQIDSLIKVTDNKGNITYASPSFKTVLGYEPEDMLGQGWWIRSTPDLKTANEVQESVMSAVNHNKSLTDKLRYRWVKSKDGKNKLFQWTRTKGVEDSLIFIGIDITEKQEKEAQFKTLTETAHDAIILVDHDGVIFEWNKSSEETFGYTKEEIKGKPLISLMPEKYKPQYKNEFNTVMQKALKTSYRNQIVEGLTKEGVTFPMELSINYWKSENRYVYCYFIRDITERQREERIKEVIFNITKKANDTFSLGEFFNFIKTELGKLINTTNFFIALYDEKTDMIRTPYMVDEIDTGDDFPKGESLTGHVIDTKKAILTKMPFVTTGLDEQKTLGLGPESKCWLGVPLLVNKMAIGAMVVQSYTDENAYSQEDVALLELIAANISSIIKKTEDLDKISLLNKALIQSPQGIIVTDLNSDIEYTNPAFTKLSGYTEEEVIGVNPRILKSDKHSKEFFKNIYDTIMKGSTWYGELINKHKDGHNYLNEANISTVKNKEGQPTHYVMVFEDITEKRQLERQFINAFVEAQEVEKQNFGEELHDGISQILSAESMYINLLIEQNQDRIHDKAKFLPKIKELNNRAVNETRNIAHGLMSSQLKQSGLLIAVKNICIDFNSAKTIKFYFINKEIKEEELSNEIKTNLFRIIQELTTNINRYSSATKASVEFKKLDVSKIILTVKDNGIGMDYDKIKKAGKVTGLQNVERRIILLNGTFDVKSSPKKGTNWKIEIPL